MLASRAAWVGFNARHFMDCAGRKAMEIYPFLGKYVQTISFWEVYSILACDCHLCKRDLYSLFVASGFRAGTFLIWQVAGRMFLDAPCFGGGSFAALYMPAQGAWLEAHPGSSFAMVAGNNEHVFNEFLRVA